jgi:hypothetical protein
MEASEAERTERRYVEEQAEAERITPLARVRDDDLEPHAGLRYIARLFKILAIVLAALLIAEIVIGLTTRGAAAIPTLMVEVTRLIVFAAFLWAAGDIALMLISSNHDLRATRILVGRLNAKVDRMVAAGDEEDGGSDLPPGRPYAR